MLVTGKCFDVKLEIFGENLEGVFLSSEDFGFHVCIGNANSLKLIRYVYNMYRIVRALTFFSCLCCETHIQKVDLLSLGRYHQWIGHLG